jgi:hypothetical protein
MLTNESNHLMLSDKAYNIAKVLVQVILPATASLYFGLSAIWVDLPHPDKVVGTIVVVTTFLGVVLGVSSRQYHASGAGFDGQMVVTESDEGNKVVSLELDFDPGEIEERDNVNFRVTSTPSVSGDEQLYSD